MTARPRALLAMSGRLADAAFTAEQRDRLDALVDLMHDTPVESWTSVPGALLADVEVVIGHWGCPPLDDDALSALPALRLFAYAAGSVKEAGTVTPAVFERGIAVTTAAAANAVPVAEYTLAVILLANKGVFVAREQLRRSGVDVRQPDPAGNLGKRVGLIGASRTGRRVAELLRPFDLDVVVHDPYLGEDDAAALGAAPVGLDELLRTADVVSVHAPLTPATESLIGAAELATLKDGAVLVNTARGRLVDTAALESELASARISAVLDVTWPEPLPADSPLLHLPNAFVTPHLAGSMGSELQRLADSAIDEVARYVRGGALAHPVVAAEFERLA
jgi:phosphoglycerate dehydrogenase-like enzyme